MPVVTVPFDSTWPDVVVVREHVPQTVVVVVPEQVVFVPAPTPVPAPVVIVPAPLVPKPSRN